MKVKLLKLIRQKYEIKLMDMNYHLIDKKNKTVIFIHSNFSRCTREMFINTCGGFEVCRYYDNKLKRNKQSLYIKIKRYYNE